MEKKKLVIVLLFVVALVFFISAVFFYFSSDDFNIINPPKVLGDKDVNIKLIVENNAFNQGGGK